jgi:hypothetical protein
MWIRVQWHRMKGISSSYLEDLVIDVHAILLVLAACEISLIVGEVDDSKPTSSQGYIYTPLRNPW